MINRFYRPLVILIFLSLINFNAFGQDQFNFDITEVEILESGNIYKGYKRGTITTDNGLSINADRFIYDKTLNILNTYYLLELFLCVLHMLETLLQFASIFL